jgi:hypothetical protein
VAMLTAEQASADPSDDAVDKAVNENVFASDAPATGRTTRLGNPDDSDTRGTGPEEFVPDEDTPGEPPPGDVPPDESAPHGQL